MKCAAKVWRRTWVNWPRGSTIEVLSITDKNWKWQSLKNLNPSRAMISSYSSLLIGIVQFFLPLVLTNVIRYFVTWERVRFTASRQRAPVLRHILTIKASSVLWRWQSYSSSVICSCVSQAISFSAIVNLRMLSSGFGAVHSPSRASSLNTLLK